MSGPSPARRPGLARTHRGPEVPPWAAVRPAPPAVPDSDALRPLPSRAAGSTRSAGIGGPGPFRAPIGRRGCLFPAAPRPRARAFLRGHVATRSPLRPHPSRAAHAWEEQGRQPRARPAGCSGRAPWARGPSGAASGRSPVLGSAGQGGRRPSAAASALCAHLGPSWTRCSPATSPLPEARWGNFVFRVLQLLRTREKEGHHRRQPVRAPVLALSPWKRQDEILDVRITGELQGCPVQEAVGWLTGCWGLGKAVPSQPQVPGPGSQTSFL